MSFTLRARWVLPVDGPPIAGGYVAIADGRIAAVGPGDPEFGEVQDLGDVVLMPGLVNAHTHLEFSTLMQPLGASGMSLPAWIRLVIGMRKRGDRDAAAAIAAGLAEGLASGVTTIGEIATSPATHYSVGEPCPRTVLFQEAIGFSAGRIDSVFNELHGSLDRTPAPSGLSPHAPYTVNPLLLERIVELAASRGVPVAMHLAESRDELQLLATGAGPFRELLEERSMWDPDAIAPGVRPLDYLRTLANAPRTLVIHGNYLADEEIEFIGARRERMSVVFCPRTHAYFDHATYPLQAMRAAGVPIALGTDSRASNPDLSLLNEMRFAAERFQFVSLPEWLAAATLTGAAALGLVAKIGSLAVGKVADLVALPCSAASTDPYGDIFETPSAPAGVWLGGVEIRSAPARTSPATS